MTFTGFNASDFAVFSIPDFPSRMATLRAQITPKLRDLGEELLPAISKATGSVMHPHVALHIRRTTNPPEETWVAFSPEKKSYKPFVHFRAGISAGKIRVTVFVEDYADEKEVFAKNLRSNSEDLTRYFTRHKEILGYSLLDDEGRPLFGALLDSNKLRFLSDRLLYIKSMHAIFGIAIPEKRALAYGSGITAQIVKAAKALKPVYELGKRE